MGRAAPGRKAGSNPISSKLLKKGKPSSKGKTKKGSKPSKPRPGDLAIAALTKQMAAYSLGPLLGPRRSKPKPQRKPAIPRGPASLGLSPCAAKFALAIADPWCPEAAGVCNPAGNIAIPSQKVRGFARITMAVGTNGWGWAIMAPCTARDAYCAVYTDATYSQVPVSTAPFNGGLPVFTSGALPRAALPGVRTLNMRNLPFGVNDLITAGDEYGVSTGVQARIVCSGMSVQYTGKASDMGGTIYSLTKPNHQNIMQLSATDAGPTNSPFIPIPDITAFAETRVDRVGPHKVWTLDYARNQGEEQYAPNRTTAAGSSPEIDTVGTVYPFSQSGLLGSAQFTFGADYMGAPCSIILINGTPLTTYELELVTHIEYAGLGAQYALTPSHSDSAGHSKVIAAAAGLGPGLAADPQANPMAVMLSGLQGAAAQAGGAAMAAADRMLYTASKGLGAGLSSNYPRIS